MDGFLNAHMGLNIPSLVSTTRSNGCPGIVSEVEASPSLRRRDAFLDKLEGDAVIPAGVHPVGQAYRFVRSAEDPRFESAESEDAAGGHYSIANREPHLVSEAGLEPRSLPVDRIDHEEHVEEEPWLPEALNGNRKKLPETPEGSLEALTCADRNPENIATDRHHERG